MLRCETQPTEPAIDYDEGIISIWELISSDKRKEASLWDQYWARYVIFLQRTTIIYILHQGFDTLKM